MSTTTNATSDLRSAKRSGKLTRFTKAMLESRIGRSSTRHGNKGRVRFPNVLFTAAAAFARARTFIACQLGLEGAACETSRNERPKLDTVDQASLGSFPASDPPSFSPNPSANAPN